MSQLLEIALLVGGINAGNAMLPGLGMLLVIGIYLLMKLLAAP